MKKTVRLFFFTAAASVLAACGSNPLDVDVSKIKVEEVKIKRFEQELFAVSDENFMEQNEGLKQKYGEYYSGFVENLIWRMGADDTLFRQHLLDFVRNKDMRSLYDECQKIFADMGGIEKELTEAFRYVKYYFPDKRLPFVVSTMTGFNSSISFADSIFAIGLDMYLGEKNKFYDYAQFPFYRRKVMNPHNVVPDFLKGWAMNEFPSDSSKGDLLSEMIYAGKIMYLVDAFLPHHHDTCKIGYTKKQLDWCQYNESNIWAHIIEEEKLYSTSAEDVAKFMNEGPFTSGFVKESPARTGIWLGWQMVRQYMKRTGKTIPDLMKENDAKKILDESKYKPG